MLEGDGLVKRYPGRGYLVTEITPQDVDEIFELRLQLELLALRKAYAVLSPELLRGLEAQLERLGKDSSPDEYYCADRTLHELLAQYCGNARLQAFLNTLDSQIERVRYISARRPDRLTESRLEHLDIIHALMAQDLPLAEENSPFISAMWVRAPKPSVGSSSSAARSLWNTSNPPERWRERPQHPAHASVIRAHTRVPRTKP